MAAISSVHTHGSFSWTPTPAARGSRQPTPAKQPGSGCGEHYHEGSAWALACPALLLAPAWGVGRARRGQRRGRLAGATSTRRAVSVRPGALLEEVWHGGQACQLLEWPLPAQATLVDAWLERYKLGGQGSEADFWRQRTVMAIQRKLEPPGDAWDMERSGSRRGEGDPSVALSAGVEPLGIRAFALHEVRGTGGAQLRGDPEAVPLALAITAERSFPVGPLEALHLDQIIARPDPPSELRGAGAALVRSLLSFATVAGRVLTVEPQSSALETYFGDLGFRPAPQIDPYLWFLTDASAGGGAVEVRYIFQDQDDHDRLLVAFKRPPLWTATQEEVFVASRQDMARQEIVNVRVSRMESFTSPRATARLFKRGGAQESHKAGPAETVELNEAAAVMRNPDLLGQLAWDATKNMRVDSAAAAVHGGRFTVLGRCNVQKRAFPLPGLASVGIELVIDACELPTCAEPVFSVSAKAPVALLGDAVEAMKALLDKYRVRASLCASSTAWNLELVLSDGLAAASMDFPELADDEDDLEMRRLDDDDEEALDYDQLESTWQKEGLEASWKLEADAESR